MGAELPAHLLLALKKEGETGKKRDKKKSCPPPPSAGGLRRRSVLALPFVDWPLVGGLVVCARWRVPDSV